MSDVRLSECPVARVRGKVVPPETLRALLRPEAQRRITAGRYRFCGAPDCDVVYFAETGGELFRREDLTVRVGIKEEAPPRTLCYCFGYTAEAILAEVRERGASTVPDTIRARIQSEGCDCARTNPQGSCCLGVVTDFVDEATGRRGEGT